MFGLGFTEALVAVLCLLAVSALLIGTSVLRAHRKLGNKSNPTPWQYANELGGYCLLGILLLMYTLGSLMGWLFSLL